MCHYLPTLTPQTTPGLIGKSGTHGVSGLKKRQAFCVPVLCPPASSQPPLRPDGRQQTGQMVESADCLRRLKERVSE